MKDLSNENIIHIKGNGIEYIQFRKLLEYKDLCNHAFTLKDLNFGIHGDIKANIGEVINNNKIICNEIGMDYRKIVKPFQSHTDNIQVVNEKFNKDAPDMYLDKYRNTDGIITNKNDFILATVNADCMLLLFLDPVKKVVGNSHSGWRGAFSKISQKTVQKMIKEYGSNPEDIICCISPSIGVCHFEVGPEVKDLCEELFTYTHKLEDIIKTGRSISGTTKYCIDIIELTKILLQETGLKAENIIDSKICSVCESDQVHSRRASKVNDFKHSTAIIGLI